ncbi:MAG: DUF481 domain-containing protein [Opitutae bacterium]|nr:DUF481 domain-containing protein [Opitutae bacterium]
MHIRLVFLVSLTLFVFGLQLSALSADDSAQALELILNNGDRLNGTLVGQTDSHVVLAHPSLGEMEIAKSALQTLPASLQAIPPASDASPDPDPAAGPAPPSPGETEADETVIGLDDLHGLALYLPRTLTRTLVKMKASIGLSYNLQKSSKDHEDRRFFFNSQWDNGKSNFRLDTDYRFAETDEEISKDRLLADFRFRRNRTENLVLQTLTSYRMDGIRKFNHFFKQGVGLGRNWEVSPRLAFVAGSEIAAVYRDLEVANEELGGSFYLGSLFQDAELKINDVYQLDQKAMAYLDPSDDENWGYAFEVKLTGKISRGLSLRLGYEFNYDNQVPPTVPEEESNFYSSIMYTF